MFPKTWLSTTFNLEIPMILAPMFLVSNVEMIVAASENGLTGCIPALNYKTIEGLIEAMTEIKNRIGDKAFGINLIVNKSNVLLDKQLEACLKFKPAYIITSLGSPEKIIKACKPVGIKVLCDVVDLEYALKVEQLGADAIIAVNSGAGGHAGPIAASILVPMLKKACKIPIISAGGVGTGAGLFSVLALGCDGVSVGSPFIATKECPVSQDYKQAIVDYGAEDIAMTDKISGSSCTVIKTPYVEKIGLKQNFLEHFLNSNRKIKKYAKMLTYYKGIKLLEKAAFGASYQTVWCAGPSIEFVDEISTIKGVTERLKSEYKLAVDEFNQRLKA